jgi:DNA-binding MarR family transcriptional regulator
MADSNLVIFVSHSSVDEPLARALVELFRTALRLSAREIRCTSVDGYKLPVGAPTNDQLRREIVEADAFIGLITPASSTSVYVLFELGARWGAGRQLAPVLARRADVGLLAGPLATTNALVLTGRPQVLQLIQDVADHLKLALEPIASFDRAIESVVAAANAAQPSGVQPARGTDNVSSEELQVLQILASFSDDITAEQVAERLQVSEQKAKYFLDDLETKKLVFILPVVYGITTYSITQDGRRILVQRGLL